VHEIGPEKKAARLRTGLTSAFCLFLLIGTTGCAHKKLKSALPIGVLAPIDLEPAPEPNTEIASVPPPELAPLPPPAPPKPAPRRRSAPKEEQPQPPAQVASNVTPAPLALGVITAGADTTPESLQQARDLIAAMLKRVADLPASVADAEKKTVRQIKNYLNDAQQALNGGDAQGATNLATKAKILLDDLEKK
jgi:hypothetical protein